MKKTLITLMTLAGVAAAADISTSFSTAGWELGKARETGGAALFTIADGNLTLTNSNWGQQYANYSFVSYAEGAYAMGQDSTLTFSVTMTPVNMSLSAVFYVVTADKAYAIGKDYDQDYFSYGKGDLNSVGVYNFDPPSQNNSGACYLGGDQNRLGTTDTLAVNTAITLSGTVAWNGEAGSYMMSLSDGTSTVDWNLRTTSFDITGVGFYGDGANNNNVTFSNLSVTATNVTLIPEPATATLSLLALAGLAARRRRK